MNAPPTPANFYDVMAERGLVAQCTDAPDAFHKRLERPIVAYCGFDPTADSLHIGSLVPIMGLAHLQRCGHKPLVLVGGATGLVGDPSGKSEARRMLSEKQVRDNAEAIARQIGRIVSFGGGAHEALLVNNIDWIRPLSWLDVLRDVGSRVSVNRMMSMESVKQRMTAEGEGISYLEFSYMLLQAYDFAHLFREHGCTLQLGGQDQWGNIVMGTELGRKLHEADLAGLTFPLVTRADGGKFGKSEAGNVWLDSDRTSVFDFFQFWRNVADADVGRYLGYFTFLPMDEVRTMAEAEGAAINAAKVRLAFEVTRLVHGEAQAAKARDAAAGAFGGSGASGGGGSGGGVDVSGEAIPSRTLDAAQLEAGLSVIEALTTAGFAKSNSEARRLIDGGGVRLHDTRIDSPDRRITPADAPDGYVLLRAGKKRLFRFDVG